ncbi:MAG: hypothetical protein OXB88_08730 [Bacteriovoracales bacterium]|nr:hypothetical protein [Bacteriovoracales bacterium]
MQVAIVCSRIRRAKALRDILKNWVSVCYVHTDFDDFWQNSQKEPAPLYLIDVEMIDAGKEKIADHPHYKSSLMNVAFFYSPSSFHLMSAPYLKTCCGHFDIESKDISQKLFDILESLKVNRDREREMLKLKVELHDIRGRFNQTIETAKQMKRTFGKQQLLGKLIFEIDRQCGKRDFLEAFGQVLEGCDFVYKYALFELVSNSNDPKLVSPPLKGAKVQHFPSLQLGKDHDILGIEHHAQGLAHQVAVDHLGREVVSMGLKLHSKTFPKLLIYLVVDKSTASEIDWDLFQLTLSGFYHRSRIKGESFKRSSRHFVSQWEFYDLLEERGKDQKKSSHIIVLEFQKLTAAITKKRVGGFQWRRFYEELTATLEEKIEHHYLATSLGRWGMAFFVSNEYLKSLHRLLLDSVEAFPYWRFFDDSDEILALNLEPQINILNSSSEEFFDYMAKMNREDTDRYMADRKEKKRTYSKMNDLREASP